MGPDLVVVLTPIFYFSPGIVKAHEPVGVEAFGAELAVEGFDEGIVGRLAGAGEVEDDALVIGPQIEIAGDEFRALIDTDRLRIAGFTADPFQCLNDVLAAIGEPGVDGR